MLTVEQCLRAIEVHTRGLADAAGGNLDVRVEHCPDWSVADLVHHLTEVHTFWEHVARTRPDAPPEIEVPRAPDDELVAAMTAAMDRLVTTLRNADQQAPCWTWGLEENVWFITRHQVQEAAVHHWDAVNAVGADWAMDAGTAADAVEEFLTHSVANRRWPARDAEPLGTTLHLGDWTVRDGEPGTLAADCTGGGAADPSDVLLWLYRRTPGSSEGLPEHGPLVERFRAFTNTD